jgi:hypothetical protein
MSHDDIWGYIKDFVVVNDYYKMSCVSKSFSREYNVKRLILKDDMKSIYKIYGATSVTILNIINNNVIKRDSYIHNKYIHANITKSISVDNIFNVFIYNDKLEIINSIYSLLYSSINQKYKNIINIIEDFKLKYHTHGNFKINLSIFTDIMHFMLDYIKKELNFKRYSNKTKILCKLNISLIVIIIVKTEKIIGVDETNASNNNNKIIRALYNSIIDEKIIDIINSVLEFQHYYPSYFAKFVLNLLNSFVDLEYND